MTREIESRDEQLEKHFKDILTNMFGDLTEHPEKDLVNTPKRVMNMYLYELFSGYYEEKPQMKVFKNNRNYDEIIKTEFTEWSMCAHHLVPFECKIKIGYIPDKYFNGLSKFSRIAKWVCRRPQLQESLTMEIADYLEEALRPKGLIVYITGKHLCQIMRGVEKQDAIMKTSVARGVFRDSLKAKEEFFKM